MKPLFSSINRDKNLLSKHFYLLTIFLSAPNIAFSQSVSPTNAPGVSSSSLLQTLFALIFIIVLLFALVFVLRRFTNLKTFGAKGPMRVAGALMIGPKERILLIEVDNTWLVVGVVPGQIKTLHTLPKGELPEPSNNEAAFGKWLKQISERNHEAK